MGRGLLILGAGQFGKLIFELAQQMNCFERIAFLDDASPVAVGLLNDYASLRAEFSDAVVAIGNPDVRLAWVARLSEAGYTVPSIVSPSAYVSPSATLGKGCVIEPNATVQTGCVLGDVCIVASGAVVRHNACMESGACLDCNAVIMSGKILPSKVKVSALTVYEQ